MTAVLLFFSLMSLAWLSALCSGTETAYYRASPVRLRARAAAGDPAARRAERLRATLPRLVNETLIGNNIVTYLATVTFTAFWTELGLTHATAWTTILLTPTLFLTGEVTPKQLACGLADAWAMAVARVWWAFRPVLAPVAAPLTAFTGLLRRTAARFDPTARESDPRVKLLAWFETGEAEKALTRNQHQMARRIIALSSVRAEELAIPLDAACRLPEAATGREAMAAMARAHDVDGIDGATGAVLVDARRAPTGRVVLMKALWRRPDAWDASVSVVSEEALVLDAEASLEEVLGAFWRREAQMALVARGGRPVGVLTARALLSRVLESGKR